MKIFITMALMMITLQSQAKLLSVYVGDVEKVVADMNAIQAKFIDKETGNYAQLTKVRGLSDGCMQMIMNYTLSGNHGMRLYINLPYNVDQDEVRVWNNDNAATCFVAK